MRDCEDQKTEKWQDLEYFHIARGNVHLKLMYVMRNNGQKIPIFPGIGKVQMLDLRKNGWHVLKPEDSFSYYRRTGLPSWFGKRALLAE